MKEGTNIFLNKKCLLKKVAAVSLAVVTALAAVPTTTLIANAEETQVFIPFRSDYINYLSEYSTETNSAENIYLFAKAMGEMYSNANWTKTYHTEVVLPGGTYLSDSAAANHPLYKNGVADPVYDQLIANLITANGATFLNSWINGYTAKGTTYLSAATGKESFINSFDNEHESFAKTSNAIIKYTKTSEGLAWLNQFSFANTGKVEHSVGVTILKLLCDNWKDLDSNQANWCKAYLPYLLENYSTYGNSAIAAKGKNSDLYDFMARSVNGAQSGLSSKVYHGISLQQEFFNYVVSSGQGFGSFCQNVIGGGNYTAVTPNRTISGVSIAGVGTAKAMFTDSNANANYTQTSLGDGDYDWFGHGVYLNSETGSNNQFATIRTLINNNSTTKFLYDDWVKRFRGTNGGTYSWSSVTNYNITSNNTNSSGGGGNFFLTGSGSNRQGGADCKTEDNSAISSKFKTYPLTSVTKEAITGGVWGTAIYQICHTFRKMHFNINEFSYLVVEYETPISYGASAIKVQFGNVYGSVGSYDNVFIEVVSPTTKTTVGHATCPPFGEATVEIPDSAWKQDSTLKLRFTYNPSQAVDYAFNSTNAYDVYSHAYQWTISSITEYYKGGISGLDGYTWNGWQKTYSKDYKTCRLYRTVVGHSDIIESEDIEATIEDKGTYYLYTYTPKTIKNYSSWTQKFSKDLGSGMTQISLNSNNLEGTITSATFTTTIPEGSYGNGVSIPNVTHSHPGPAMTEVIAFASGTAKIKAGVIKQNVKSITITSNGYSLTAILYDKEGKPLVTASGANSVTLDASKASAIQLEGCYMMIFHKSSSYNKAIKYYNNWYMYPGCSTSTYSRITGITANY